MAKSPVPLTYLSEADIERFRSKITVRKQDECWGWNAGANKDGRGKFNCKRNQKQTCFNAPRIAYWLHKGHDPGAAQVLHNCNNAACCNPNHLYLGDDTQNRRDSQLAGTISRGSDRPLAKLTETKVRAIRRQLALGTSGRELAVEHEVSESLISQIRRKIAWRHVHG